MGTAAGSLLSAVGLLLVLVIVMELSAGSNAAATAAAGTPRRPIHFGAGAKTGKNRTVSMLIIPSTKWCGNGNVATNYDNLGSEYETDKCCRDHDTCPHSIVGRQTRYGLTNPFLTTVSECECDVSFYFCLQQAAKISATAQFAITSFFKILNMPCFELVERTVCKKRHFPLGHCLVERNETVAELRRLPFFTDHLAKALASGRLRFRDPV